MLKGPVPIAKELGHHTQTGRHQVQLAVPIEIARSNGNSESHLLREDRAASESSFTVAQHDAHMSNGSGRLLAHIHCHVDVAVIVEIAVNKWRQLYPERTDDRSRLEGPVADATVKRQAEALAD